MTFDDEVLATVARIARACETVAVPWAVGGSFASGLYGEPRATNDIDVIACLRLGDVRRFVGTLGEDVYVDEAMIREAIAGCRSFNVIDEKTFVKIDVFVPPPGPLGEGQLLRRRQLELGEGSSTWVLGPEDTLLQKLAVSARRRAVGSAVARHLCHLARFEGSPGWRVSSNRRGWGEPGGAARTSRARRRRMTSRACSPAPDHASMVTSMLASGHPRSVRS